MPANNLLPEPWFSFLSELDRAVNAVSPQPQQAAAIHDDALTICAISIVAGILTNILHEGVGHGLERALPSSPSTF